MFNPFVNMLQGQCAVHGGEWAVEFHNYFYRYSDIHVP